MNKDQIIQYGAILLLCIMLGFAHTFFQTSQHEKESRDMASMEELSRCASDGRLYWNYEEQRCYEKGHTENRCILLERWGKTETINLPSHINRSGIFMNISECNTTLIDSIFLCKGVQFRAWSILEDMLYQTCIDGFTISTHPDYGYAKVRYFGEYERASDYPGMVVIPFDEEGCNIAYYKVENVVKENVGVCWI